jgi:hypothetical protein
MKPSEILELREKRQLHPKSEERIKQLLGKIPIQNYGLPEGWGLTSGRTDLSVYLKHRFVIHFEIFGHPSTVFRDVNNLHMSRADVKVALIIDEDADPGVPEAYFRAVPDNRFHWYPLSTFIDPVQEKKAIEVLTALLEEAVKTGGPLTGTSASVTPASGAPFTRGRLKVSGFHPYSGFNAFWDPDGQTCVVGGSLETDQNGSGECDVLIPDGRIASVGMHVLRVVDSVGNIATAKFEVTEAWPAPYLRALPSSRKPGELLTIGGGGAPRNSKVMVYFWTGNRGEGRPEVIADDAGNFQCAFELPWLVGVELVKPGRHRISASRARGEASSYHVNTYVEVLEYAPPESLQWKSERSQAKDGICVLRPEFTVLSDLITVRLHIRNDRTTPIRLQPSSVPVIFENDTDLRYSEYTFTPVFVGPNYIQPTEEALVVTQFRRRFVFLPKALVCPARGFALVLEFGTAEGETITLRFYDVWPADVWAEPGSS